MEAFVGKLVGPAVDGVRWLLTWVLRAHQARRGEVLRVAHRPLSQGGSWRLALNQALTPEDLASLRSVASADVREWLGAHKGAFPSGVRRDDLRLAAIAVRGLVIEDVVAVVELEDRVAGPVGALVESPPAGAREAVLMGFDLTKGGDPRAVVVREDGDLEWTHEPYCQRHDIALDARESIPVGIVSRTGNDTVRWRLQFTVQVEGKIRRVLYPPAGEPPLVTSGAGTAEQYWMAGVAGSGEPPWLRAVDQQEFNGGEL